MFFSHNTSFKIKNIYTEITHVLLISRLYYKNFNIKDEELFDKFYHSLSSYFNTNSDFWLQYAKIHLDQASALNLYSYKIRHTIGQWHMFNACAMDNYNDAYPVHSYIDSFIQLHNRFKFTLVSKKIKVLYLIIQTSLDKFDNHSLLLIIWKKFYQFLKRNNKTSFIKISLDE